MIENIEIPLDSHFEEEKSIEKQANSQENPSLLLFSRLRNPEIFEQLVSTYEKYYKNSGNNSPDLRERIIQKVKMRIHQIESSTPVNLESEAPESYASYANLLNDYHDLLREHIKTPLTNTESNPLDIEKSEQVQAIIESHEKGHVVRQFYLLNGVFDRCITKDSIKYSPKTLRSYMKNYSEKEIGHIPDDKLLDEVGIDVIKSLTEKNFPDEEIIERMSQLKSYFGMRGAEKFTKKHLDYAREHYVNDTGLDNLMTEFFQGITPDKEPLFLELINSGGI